MTDWVSLSRPSVFVTHPPLLHCSEQFPFKRVPSGLDCEQHVEQKGRLAPMNLASTGLANKTRVVKKVVKMKKIRAVWFMMNSFRPSPDRLCGKDKFSAWTDNLPNVYENGAWRSFPIKLRAVSPARVSYSRIFLSLLPRWFDRFCCNQAKMRPVRCLDCRG